MHAVAAVLVVALPRDPQLHPWGQLGLFVALGVVPALLLAASRWDNARAVVLAVALLVAPICIKTVHSVTGPTTYQGKHDRGVLVTEAAAREFTKGDDPYTADHTDALGSDWKYVFQDAHGTLLANPTSRYYPYLPAAFLIHAPFVVAADHLGFDYDPRFLYLAVFLAAIAMLARAPVPWWSRAATIAAAANVYVFVYLAWGTTDTAAVSLVVITALVAERHPAVAGCLLAVAVSLKALLFVAVIALAASVVARHGRRALTRWWTFPAVLAATCAPFLFDSPRAFVEDTITFNFGKAALKIPTTGLGLPAQHPSVFHGAALAAAVVVALAVSALVLVHIATSRAPPTTAIALSAVMLGALLLTARTFVPPYVTLLAVLAALGFLRLDGEADQPDRVQPRASSRPVRRNCAAAAAGSADSRTSS